MKRNGPWTVIEIQAAVEAYFMMLDAQRQFNPVNKSEIYRDLAASISSRSAKAFEYKFQNISAILYEIKLPYADGLKPMGNYQSELKEVVLKFVNKKYRKYQTPIQILTDKLIRLRRRDYLPIQGVGSGRYGLTLEHYLNIPQNSSKSADFMGIELKTKHDKSLQTLFSRVPSRYLCCDDKNGLLDKYGYVDEKRKRKALYTSFNNTPDSLGFRLTSENKRMVVINKQTEVLEYANGVIKEALLSKHNETAYISVATHRLKNGSIGCRFDQMLYCKTPSISRFLRMSRKGDVYLDFTLSEKNGKVKDHGFLWRVQAEALGELYAQTELLEFTVN